MRVQGSCLWMRGKKQTGSSFHVRNILCEWFISAMDLGQMLHLAQNCFALRNEPLQPYALGMRQGSKLNL